MKNVTLSLEAKEVMRLTQIVMDQDAEQALSFIRDTLEPKIKATEHGHCRAWSDEEEKSY